MDYGFEECRTERARCERYALYSMELGDKELAREWQQEARKWDERLKESLRLEIMR